MSHISYPPPARGTSPMETIIVSFVVSSLTILFRDGVGSLLRLASRIF
jgi:hypothetical protein